MSAAGYVCDPVVSNSFRSLVVHFRLFFAKVFRPRLRCAFSRYFVKRSRVGNAIGSKILNVSIRLRGDRSVIAVTNYASLAHFYFRSCAHVFHRIAARLLGKIIAVITLFPRRCTLFISLDSTSPDAERLITSEIRLVARVNAFGTRFRRPRSNLANFFPPDIRKTGRKEKEVKSQSINGIAHEGT